jgi:hypothetical protein
MEFLMGLIVWSGAALVVAGMVIGVSVWMFGLGWLTGTDTRHRRVRHNSVTGW